MELTDKEKELILKLPYDLSVRTPFKEMLKRRMENNKDYLSTFHTTDELYFQDEEFEEIRIIKGLLEKLNG